MLSISLLSNVFDRTHTHTHTHSHTAHTATANARQSDRPLHNSSYFFENGDGYISTTLTAFHYTADKI
jgi:hypothetical protein